MRASVSGGSTSSAPAERVTPPLFERSSDDRVIAGVCGGIGARLAVDPTLVRLVFAILALAGGAGILVYLALWIYARGRRALPAAALLAVASGAMLFGLGLSGTARPPGGSLPRLGVALLMAGAVIFLGRRGVSGGFLAPAAVAGGLLRGVGPGV